MLSLQRFDNRIGQLEYDNTVTMSTIAKTEDTDH